jgi:5-methylcytosine-specific restriction endonuclease McrA
METEGNTAMSRKALIPAKIRTATFARFDCCAACGTWDADECGHIVAESNGGAMVAENFVRLCGRCNRLQGVATVSFAAYAVYTETRAIVESRRAMWAKYCSASTVKRVKPYNPL